MIRPPVTAALSTGESGLGRGPLALEIRSRIATVPLATFMKGLPAAPVGATVADIGDLGWVVTRGDLPTPCAVLSASALAHNARVMADYCTAHGVSLAPHGKTTMAPQLIDLQLVHGAWAITSATVAQTRLFAEFGVDRVLLANEVTDRAGLSDLARLVRASDTLEVYMLVDSVTTVRLMDEAFRAESPGRPISVLVELGSNGGRAGARTIDDVVSVAREVRRTATLRLCGIEGYEGVVPGNDSADSMAVDGFLDDMVSALVRVGEEDLLETPEPIISAGGSIHFDRVVEHFAEADARVVLRPGCYLIHDHGKYMRRSPLDGHSRGGPRLEPALVVWGSVVSTPEPGLAVFDAGRRDLSFDAGLPVVTGIVPRGGGQLMDAGGQLEVVRLMDQHSIVNVDPAATVSVGDLVVLGVSHPCTTFDKWRVLPVVDSHGVVVDAVVTYF